MENFYIYFFLRQILSLIIFISSINPIAKIIIIFFLDLISSHQPFYYGKEIMNQLDRVVLLQTVGSIFSYTQIAIIIVENHLLKSKEFKILLLLFSFHIVKTLKKLEVIHMESEIKTNYM